MACVADLLCIAQGALNRANCGMLMPRGVSLMTTADLADLATQVQLHAGNASALQVVYRTGAAQITAGQRLRLLALKLHLASTPLSRCFDTSKSPECYKGAASKHCSGAPPRACKGPLAGPWRAACSCCRADHSYQVQLDMHVCNRCEHRSHCHGRRLKLICEHICNLSKLHMQTSAAGPPLAAPWDCSC